MAPKEEEKVRADLADLWKAWHLLRFDRFFGSMGGSAPITFVAIDTYARRYGYQGESFDLLLRCVAAMDSVHLEIEAEKEKARAQK